MKIETDKTDHKETILIETDIINSEKENKTFWLPYNYYIVPYSTVRETLFLERKEMKDLE